MTKNRITESNSIVTLSPILSEGYTQVNFDQQNIENLTVILKKIKYMNEPDPKQINRSVHLHEDAEISQHGFNQFTSFILRGNTKPCGDDNPLFFVLNVTKWTYSFEGKSPMT